MAKMDGFSNSEHGRKMFDQRRVETVSEINLLCQEMGIGVSDALLNTSRFEVLQDFLIGKITFEPDEEGQPRTVNSSGDRLEFEYQIMRHVLRVVKAQGAQFAEQAGAAEARAQLIVPGRGMEL